MKFGIKNRYPRVSRYNDKLSAYFSLIRPFSLVAPIMVGIIGVLLERTYHNEIITDWLTLLFVGITIALFQATGQVINQATDYNIDRWNKPYRPIPSGKITKEEAYAIGFVLAIFALWRAATINERFLFYCIILLVFAIGYSADPVRIKERPVYVSLPWLATSRGLIPILATWAVYAYPRNEFFPWALGIVAFCWVLAFQASKDFSDESGDREYEIPTLVTIYGREKALQMIAGLSMIFPLIIMIFISNQHFPQGFYLLYLLIPVELLILFFIKGNVESKLENNMGWVLFYLGLGLIPVISTIALIL